MFAGRTECANNREKSLNEICKRGDSSESYDAVFSRSGKRRELSRECESPFHEDKQKVALLRVAYNYKTSSGYGQVAAKHSTFILMTTIQRK